MYIKKLLCVLLIGLGGAMHIKAQQKELCQWVNPFIGTDYTGNTYPGAQVPFGMVQLSPDNGLPGWDRIAGYFYPDSTIAGFSHTHLSGTGAGDLYDISYLPVTLPYRESAGELGVHSRFSHADEEAHAGYYRVRLQDYNINVELTATARCGIQRYTFPKAKSAVFLNLAKAMNWDRTVDSYVEQVDAYTIRGYRYSDGWARNQKVYFATRFSRPIQDMKLERSPIGNADKKAGTAVIARFYFDTEEGEQITLCTALSGINMDGAMRNLKTEAPHNEFDTYRRGAETTWNKALGKILISTSNADRKTVFYTAFYHSMLAPTLYKDVDGSYRGIDGQQHIAEGWNYYTTFSLWDTYRALHPLLLITHPRESRDMVTSLVRFAQEGVRLPVWNMFTSETDMMLGYHAVSVIADAAMKGLAGVPLAEALDVCERTANLDAYRNIGEYKKLGYVPLDSRDSFNDDNWAMSKTLEYAYDDATIARLARFAKRKNIAKAFGKRAKHYVNTFNPKTEFFQPRDSKGEFLTPFVPEDYNQYITESNAWQYLFSVQHDVKGLKKLLGGEKKMVQKLDDFFGTSPKDKSKLPIFSTGMIGQYAHGNEPGHHVPYLYNTVKQPWRTAELLHRIATEFYTNTPAGLCGNEDCGQMSAWYVFTAMGFYPVDPTSNEYEIGTPLLDEVLLPLHSGRKLLIRAKGLSDTHKYVKEVTLNGKRHKRSTLSYDELQAGGVLEFTMTNQSNICWY